MDSATAVTVNVGESKKNLNGKKLHEQGWFSIDFTVGVVPLSGANDHQVNIALEKCHSALYGRSAAR